MERVADVMDWWWSALWLPLIGTILVLMFAAGANT